MAHAFTHHHYLLYGMAAIGAFLTSFYMFRLTYLTFYGTSRMDHHTEEHVHESPMVMVGPLMVVRGAVHCSVGFWDFPLSMAGSINSLHRSQAREASMTSSTGLVLMLMMIATGIALLGWGLAHYFYSVNLSAPDRLAAKFQAGLHDSCSTSTTSMNSMIFYSWSRPRNWGCLLDWFDRTVIDGLVRAVAQLAELGAAGSTWVEKYVIYGGSQRYRLRQPSRRPPVATTAKRDGPSLCRHHCGGIILAGSHYSTDHATVRRHAMLEELASTFPILSCILFFPLAGAVVLWLFDDEDMVRTSALTIALGGVGSLRFRAHTIRSRFGRHAVCRTCAVDSRLGYQLSPRGGRHQRALRRTHGFLDGPGRHLFLGHRPPSE